MKPLKPWLRRALLVSGIVLAVLAVAIVAITWWLVGTESGFKFIVASGTSRSPVTITIDKVEGRVLGPLRLGGIVVEQSGTKLRIEGASLDWDASGLWKKQLYVRSLLVDGVALTLGPPDPNAPPPKPFERFDIELPVDVVVDSLRLRAISFRQAGRPDSFAIREIGLDGLRYEDSLGVQRFAVATPWGELGFRGWVQTRGPYPLDLAIQWSLTPPGQPRIAGSGTITGNLDTLGIQQHVTEPAQVFVTARLESLTTRLRFDASAKLEPIALRSLRKDLPAATVSATIAARGNAERQDITLAASYDSKETGRWNLSGDARAAMPEVELPRLVVAQHGSRARIDVSGRAHLDSVRTTVAANATWSELAWPPVGSALVTLPTGRLTGEGEAGGYRVRMESAVRGSRGLQESLRLSGHGDTTSFTLERLAGSLLDGTIDAHGQVAWKPSIAWDADVAVADVNAGILAPEWPSRIAAHVVTTGTMRGKDQWAASVDLRDLAGTLRDKPIAGRAQFEGKKGGSSTLDTEMSYAGASLTAVGPALEPMDLAWTLDVPSLAELDSTLAGVVRGSGRLTGPDSLAMATATLDASDLAYAGTRVANVSLVASVDRTRADALDVALAARSITSPPLAPFDSVRVTASGTREGYAFTAAVESALRRLAVAGTAAAHDSTWAGSIERLEFQVAENRPWNLDGPTPFEVRPASGKFGPLALRAGPARLNADADWRTGGDVRVATKLDQFPLANLNAFLPDSLRVAGTLSMTSDAVMHPDGVLDAKLAMAPLAGSVTWHDREPIAVEFQDVKLDLASDASRFEAKGGAVLKGLGHASTEFRMPGFRWNRIDSTQVIDGTLTAEATEWELVERLTHEVRKVTGRLAADLRFAGTIATPRVGGEVKFEKGAFDVPAYGLEVRELELDARADERGRWTLTSSLRSGEGTMTAKADADLSDASHPKANLALTGKDFEAIDIIEARVLVSPDMKIAIDGARVNVGGSLAVPKAKVDAGNKMIALAVPPSADVIVPRERADSMAVPFLLSTDLRLTLGDDVEFKGYGLEAEPTGEERITQQPNKPALGRGELELTTGTYSGYGRDLKIERGRLVYAGGPVDDPEVDIRASREIKDEDTLVGFEVKGTLKQSQMTVFSDPDMSQSDAISYLLFNRPISEAKSSESAIARETATAMGLQAGSAYTQKMASKIGLDEASLESEGTIQEASLMLGTYLTPSLYARYGIGLFDSANTFQISYLLNKRWTLKAETAEQNRAGILYTIEPGKKAR